MYEVYINLAQYREAGGGPLLQQTTQRRIADKAICMNIFIFEGMAVTGHSMPSRRR